MCRNATVRAGLLLAGICQLATAQSARPFASAAPAVSPSVLEWRRVGSTVVELGLASPAGGPVDRVWYSPDGAGLYVRTRAGRTWRTADGDTWTASDVQPPAQESARGLVPPEAAARIIAGPLPGVVYGAGEHLWRSQDGGAHWANLTAYQGRSILGGRVLDVAVPPGKPDEITVSGERGVWRSVDGGASWAGLNEGLLNLPAQRIVSAPGDSSALTIVTAEGTEAVWLPGERASWRAARTTSLAAEQTFLSRAAASRGGLATAAVRGGEVAYAGFADGRLAVSADRGRTWQDSPSPEVAARIERLFTDERGPAFAIAVTAASGRGRVLRTVNRGAFWDDITADLPPGAVHGVTADRLTGAVYIATDAGVFLTWTDTNAAAPATPWTRLRDEAALDVALDAGGNQLYVLLNGAGVYAAMAPNRLLDPRVVSAGERVLRAAAPGALLSVIGAKIDSAQAGERPASVLAAGELESQVQLPYDLPGTAVTVAFQSAGGRIQIGLPVSSASPSIFLDKDGNALLMNADSGLMLDAGSPARSRTRVQVIVSGLGNVTPSWPPGLAAPLQDPPRVVVPVRAYIDRQPVEVTRATLAPGYVGLYLVEFEVPTIVNRGPAELYLEAARQTSNRVQLWLEP